MLKHNIPSELLVEDIRDMTLAKGNYTALEKTGAAPVLLTGMFCLAHQRLCKKEVTLNLNPLWHSLCTGPGGTYPSGKTHVDMLAAFKEALWVAEGGLTWMHMHDSSPSSPCTLITPCSGSITAT